MCALIHRELSRGSFVSNRTVLAVMWWQISLKGQGHYRGTLGFDTLWHLALQLHHLKSSLSVVARLSTFLSKNHCKHDVKSESCQINIIKLAREARHNSCTSCKETEADANTSHVLLLERNLHNIKTCTKYWLEKRWEYEPFTSTLLDEYSCLPLQGKAFGVRNGVNT